MLVSMSIGQKSISVCAILEDEKEVADQGEHRVSSIWNHEEAK
jgi:hypothetical protein